MNNQIIMNDDICSQQFISRTNCTKKICNSCHSIRRCIKFCYIVHRKYMRYSRACTGWLIASCLRTRRASANTRATSRAEGLEEVQDNFNHTNLLKVSIASDAVPVVVGMARLPRYRLCCVPCILVYSSCYNDDCY